MNELRCKIKEKSDKTNACTHCGRCVEVCPAGIDIPIALQIYDQYKENDRTALYQLKALSVNAGPEDCIECGVCSAHCPAGIEIKDMIRELAMVQCQYGIYQRT